ncbi:hypothetical protein Pst134EB_021761 [Puccinia striiformis f. sp. tritici]|nr:hypothetical protein Pst134EB_021761 [Puccinia striiformis f. sp. tritici]
MIPSPFTFMLVWLSASFLAAAILMRPACLDTLMENSEHFTDDPSKTLLTLESRVPLGNEHLSQKRRYDSMGEQAVTSPQPWKFEEFKHFFFSLLRSLDSDSHRRKKDLRASTDDGNSQHPMIDYMILDDLETQAYLHRIFDRSTHSCDEYEWFLETGGLWDSPSPTPYHWKRPRLDATGDSVGGFEEAGDKTKGSGFTEMDSDHKPSSSLITALQSQSTFADTAARKGHPNRDPFQEATKTPGLSNDSPRKVILGYPDAMDLTSNEIPPLTEKTVPLESPSQNQSTEDHDSKESGRNFNYSSAKEEPVKVESFKADHTSDQGMFLGNLPGKHVPQKIKEELLQELKQQNRNMKGTDQHPQEQKKNDEQKPSGESKILTIKNEISSSSEDSSQHHNRIQQDPEATATELNSKTKDDQVIKSPISIRNGLTESRIKFDLSQKPRTKSIVWSPSKHKFGPTSVEKDNKWKQMKETAEKVPSSIPKLLWLEKPSDHLAKEIGIMKVTLYGKKYTNRYEEKFKQKFESLIRSVITHNKVNGQSTRSGSVFPKSILSDLPQKALHRLILSFKNNQISQHTLWKSLDNIIGKTFYILKAMTSELQETEKERSKTIDDFYNWFFSSVFDISDSNPLTNMLVKFIDPETQHEKGFIDPLYLTGIWCRNCHPKKWSAITGSQDPHQFWINMKNILIRFENDYQFQKIPDTKNEKNESQTPGKNRSQNALDITRELINEMDSIAEIENSRKSLTLNECYNTRRMMGIYPGQGDMEQAAKSTPKDESHPFLFFDKRIPEQKRNKYYGGLVLQYETTSSTFKELRRKFEMIYLPSQLYFMIPEFWKFDKTEVEMKKINHEFTSFFKKLFFGQNKSLKPFPIFINTWDRIEPPTFASYSKFQRVLIQSLTQSRDRKDLFGVGIQMLSLWFNTEGKIYSADLFVCQEDFLIGMNKVLKEKHDQIYLEISSKVTNKAHQH